MGWGSALDSLLRKVLRRWPLTCAALLRLGLGKGEKAVQKNTMHLKGKETRILEDSEEIGGSSGKPFLLWCGIELRPLLS